MRSAMVYSLVACVRVISVCWRAASLGCFPLSCVVSLVSFAGVGSGLVAVFASSGVMGRGAPARPRGRPVRPGSARALGAARAVCRLLLDRPLGPARAAVAEHTILPHPHVQLVFEASRAGIYGLDRSLFARRLSGRGEVLGVRFRAGCFRPSGTRPSHSSATGWFRPPGCSARWRRRPGRRSYAPRPRPP